MTLWSFEVPIPHLEDFEKYQDFHFTLSILYIQNIDYLRFYKHQKDLGLKKIWLDNSVNETNKPDSPVDICNLAESIGADLIVAPDGIGWDTDRIYEAYKTVCALSNIPAISVVSSMEMYLEMGIKRIAVSYESRPRWTEGDLAKLSANGAHFLGLLSLDEILTYEPLSCDTSMPIKIALQGMTLKQWISNGCPHIHTRDLGFQGSEFFNTKLDKQTLELAKRNIEELKRRTQWL